MKKKISLVLMMAAFVVATVVLMEVLVFSKECPCFSGSVEARQTCVENCRSRIDGGCGWYWAEDQTCSTTNDLCRTKWFWQCRDSVKHGYFYSYKSCPAVCP